MSQIVPICPARLVSLIAFLFCMPGSLVVAGVLESLWVTDGPVYASIAAGDYHGDPVGGGVVVDTQSVLLDTRYPLVSGRINTVIPDGAGGWFIGGAFSSVGGIVRENIAHIDAGKRVDRAWDPGANGEVRSLALSADGISLYVGGDFTTIGSQGRERVARLSAATGTTDAGWNPAADNSVRVLVISTDGLRLYVGGSFASIGGVPRNRLAALEISSADVITGWNPAPDGDILDITFSRDGNRLYVGGEFLNVGGLARSRIAALDAGSGAVDAGWNPGADGVVRALGFSSADSKLYIGGEFTFIGGELRNRIAAIDTVAINADRATAWNPDADGPVNSFVLSGDTLYVGGDFNVIGGQVRNRLAAVNTTLDSNNIQPWDPGVDNMVNSMALADSSLYIGGNFSVATDHSAIFLGGDFTYVGPATGSGIAINADPAAPGSDRPDFTYPAVNGAVYAVVADGAGGWYIGGQFSRVGDVALNNIAHINSDLTVDSTWAPDADGAVRTLTLSGTTLYTGGDFNTFAGGSITRNYIAALDTATSVAANIPTAWAPDADGVVRTLTLSGTTLYTGGDFNTFAGGSITRNYIAALDTTTTVATSIPTAWNPDTNGVVRALQLSGTTLYAGGDFNTVGSVARSRLAAVAADPVVPLNDAPTAWNPVAGGAVYVLALSGTLIYAGGEFASVGGVMRNRLAALNLNDGQATAWNPGADGIVRTVIFSANAASLYIGGDFSVVAGQLRSRGAEIELATGLATFWDPAADAPIHTLMLAEDGASVYAGGTFSIIGGQPRNHLAEIRPNGTATFWIPELSGSSSGVPGNGAVYALAQRGTTIYAGGDFAVAGNASHMGIVALDGTTASPTNWAPQVAGVVRTMALAADGAALYIGGSFTAVGGDSRLSVAALSTLSNLATTWDPQANGDVLDLAFAQDSASLYAGGNFTMIGGNTRNRLAALAVTDGQAISNWDHQSDATVRSVMLSGSGSALYAGGDFTRIDSLSRGRLVALDALPLETDAPFTTAIPGGGNYNGITNQPVVLTCDDGAGSGCAATYFTTDGSTPTTASTLYTEPITLREDTVLKFFSVDNLGNTETINTENYILELLSPVTTATPSARIFSSSNLRVELTCVDEGSGCAQTFYTKNDNAPISQFILYEGPVKISDNVTLRFYSIDQAGNVEVVKRENYVSNNGGAYAYWMMVMTALLLLWRNFQARREQP